VELTTVAGGSMVLEGEWTKVERGSEVVGGCREDDGMPQILYTGVSPNVDRRQHAPHVQTALATVANA
jgi:hypothetical protein